jgi:hypothetical protein
MREQDWVGLDGVLKDVVALATAFKLYTCRG